MQSVGLRLSAFILFLSSFAGCGVGKRQEKKDIINSSEIAFIEFYQTQEGTVISGKAPTGRRIDGPTYRFNDELNQLTILRKEKIVMDSLTVIVGYGRVLKGSAGSGLSNLIHPVYSLPYSIDKFTISKVSSKGISLIFDRKEMFLKKGDVWQTSTTKTDTLKSATPAIIKNITTYSIHYYGLITKKGIVL